MSLMSSVYWLLDQYGKPCCVKIIYTILMACQIILLWIKLEVVAGNVLEVILGNEFEVILGNKFEVMIGNGIEVILGNVFEVMIGNAFEGITGKKSNVMAQSMF